MHSIALYNPKASRLSWKKKKKIIDMALLLLLFLLISSFPSKLSSQIIYEHVSDAYVGFVVEGEVYCQQCSTVGSWSLTGARPLPGVRLEVRCNDYKRKEIFNLPMRTNKWGWFYEPLKGFDLRSYHMDTFPRVCRVHLMYSTEPDCDVATNVNFGITGGPLRYESTLFNGTKYEADLYSAGPMAFRPSNCSLPEEEER